MALNLLDVNDDCLFGIFENLPIPDLANVASTCTRFRTIARDVYSHCHQSYCLQLEFDSQNPQTTEHLPYRRQAAAILRNCGDLLTNVEITFSEFGPNFNNRFINMMVMYCSGGNLETLKLINCSYSRLNKITDAGTLFQNVKQLTLHNISATESCLLSDANKLTRLDIIVWSATEIPKFLANDYPRLQSLSLTAGQGTSADINIVNFLKHHPDVTELELRDGGNYDFSSISECHWLRKLIVWNCHYSDVSPISQLDKLTSLKISLPHHDYAYAYAPRLAQIGVLNKSKSSQSLEELVFDGGPWGVRLVRFINLKRLSVSSQSPINDGLLADIPRLKELRVLSIAGNGVSESQLTSDGLLGLVERLPKLEKLSIHHDSIYRDNPRMELSESTYSRICDIYRNRSQKLVICNFDVTDEKQEERNRKSPFAGNDPKKTDIMPFGITDETEMNRTEPFAGDDRQKFVQYIALDRPPSVHQV